MPVKDAVKSLVRSFGGDPTVMAERFSEWSVRQALRQQGLLDLVARLREIEPDISNQEDESLRGQRFNSYWELKRRGLQAFQVRLMLQALERFPGGNITVVDVGDSAGTHMLYLRALAGKERRIDTVSVNLEERAIEKIRARGFKAVLCRAEELDLGGTPIDLFTSFEMVEHLHNPALFLRRLAKRDGQARLVITVPFRRSSQVGLSHIRRQSRDRVPAGDEHIFELCPADWTLLMLHSGWRVVHEQTYLQYPRVPLMDAPLALFWKRMDFEGFWGAILEKDRSLSDRYSDWEE